MKHGSGIKDRDDKSSGIEILTVEGFDKINPTGNRGKESKLIRFLR
jgi:hypothetical protein